MLDDGATWKVWHGYKEKILFVTLPDIREMNKTISCSGTSMIIHTINSLIKTQRIKCHSCPLCSIWSIRSHLQSQLTIVMSFSRYKMYIKYMSPPLYLCPLLVDIHRFRFNSLVCLSFHFRLLTWVLIYTDQVTLPYNLLPYFLCEVTDTS